MKYIYTEIKKSDGIVLRGVINTPDDFDEKNKYPTVIIYHGFGGDRNGSTFFRVQNARYLTDRGFVVARFDFSGTCESDGDFYDMTVSREEKEVEIIHNAVRLKPFVDRNRLYWVGHSLGGVLSSLMGYKLKPKAMCLLAPASDMNNPDYIKVMARTMFEGEIRKKKSEIDGIKSFAEIIASVEDVDIGGAKLNKRFLLDFIKKDIYGSAKKYQGNVLILRGDSDDLVFKDSNEKLRDSFPHALYEEIEGADHSFKNEDHRMIVFEKMYKFFEEN